MDNTINLTIIEKVVIKKAAIFKDICMLPPLFEDKFTKEQICQQNENTQKQNLENNLNEPEKRIDLHQNDIMNETKIVNEQESLNTTTQIKSGIYKIVNKIDGKYYVGSTKNFHKRWKYYHLRDLRLNKHKNDKLQNAWNKYGEESFEFVPVEYIQYSDKTEMLIVEQKYLNVAKNEINKCYNLNFRADGGEITVEGRKKISDAMKGNKHPFFGKRHSETHRQNISNGQPKGKDHHQFGKPIAPGIPKGPRGVTHHKYGKQVTDRTDYTLYTFVNLSLNLEVTMLRKHFIKQYVPKSKGRICDLINGKTFSVNGWMIKK